MADSAACSPRSAFTTATGIRCPSPLAEQPPQQTPRARRAPGRFFVSGVRRPVQPRGEPDEPPPALPTPPPTRRRGSASCASEIDACDAADHRARAAPAGGLAARSAPLRAASGGTRLSLSREQQVLARFRAALGSGRRRARHAAAAPGPRPPLIRHRAASGTCAHVFPASPTAPHRRRPRAGEDPVMTSTAPGPTTESARRGRLFAVVLVAAWMGAFAVSSAPATHAQAMPRSTHLHVGERPARPARASGSADPLPGRRLYPAPRRRSLPDSTPRRTDPRCRRPPPRSRPSPRKTADHGHLELQHGVRLPPHRPIWRARSWPPRRDPAGRRCRGCHRPVTSAGGAGRGWPSTTEDLRHGSSPPP